jgi:hypothetical protein
MFDLLLRGVNVGTSREVVDDVVVNLRLMRAKKV